MSIPRYSLALVLLSSCLSSAAIEMPAVPGAQSVFVVVGDGEVVWAYHAAERKLLPLGLGENKALYLVYLQERLDELGLSPGPQLLDTNATTKPLPSGTWFEADISTGTLSEIPDRVLFLKAGAPESCADSGQCLGPSYFRTCVPCPSSDLLLSIEEPILPILTPCPTHWVEEHLEEGPTVCVPPVSFASCGVGRASFLSTGPCAEVGTACPASGFPEELPGTGVLYVESSTEANAIGRALEEAAAGMIIAIAAGEYVERSLSINETMTLWGACSSRVQIRASDDTTSLVVVDTASVTMRNLSLSGGLRGVEARNSILRLEGIVIEDTVVHSEADEEAALVVVGSTVSADRLAIRETGHFGITTMDGGRLHARQVEIAETTNTGVYVRDPGSRVHLEDTIVRNTRTLDTSNGYPLRNGAEMVLERVALVENPRGLRLNRASLWGADLFLSDIHHDGFSVRDSTLTISRVSVHRSDNSGIHLYVRSRATIEDLVVVETGDPGSGITIASETGATVDRAYVADGRGRGIKVTTRYPNTPDVLFTDLLLKRNKHGVVVGFVDPGTPSEGQARFSGTRVAIESSEGSGLLSVEPSQVELMHAQIKESGWHGLNILTGEVSLTDSLIEGCRGTGINVSGPGSQVGLTRSVVVGTIAQESEYCTLYDTCVGTGIHASDRALFEATTFALERNTMFGAVVDFEARMVLQNGKITDQKVGIVVNSPFVEPEQISDSVFFFNEKNVEWHH